MFSGIVEEAATVAALKKEKENLHITLRCSFVNELRIDQSISHNGVCLTVVNSQDRSFQVAIIPYTYEVTNFHQIHPGSVVNIEFDIIGKYIARILKSQLGK